MEHELEQVLGYCPDAIADAIRQLPSDRGRMEEIRLRCGHAATVCLDGREWKLHRGRQDVFVDAAMLRFTIDRASNFSAYAVADRLKQGFLVLPGGHRIGVCGTMQPNGTLVHPSSINIRIARQIVGFAEPAMQLLWSNPSPTLIIGPPGCGKTTLLREVIRQLSDRHQYRVAVVDERWELAGSVNGVPQLQIGRHTDVLSGCGKAEGIQMLLRGMNPQWIAVDEISAEQDVQAMIAASYCGVKMLATAHADRKEDLHCRPIYKQLMQLGLFENLITVKPDRKMICERLCYGND